MLSSKKSISLINVNGARLWDLNIEIKYSTDNIWKYNIHSNKDNYLILINKNIGKLYIQKI